MAFTAQYKDGKILQIVEHEYDSEEKYYGEISEYLIDKESGVIKRKSEGGYDSSFDDALNSGFMYLAKNIEGKKKLLTIEEAKGMLLMYIRKEGDIFFKGKEEGILYCEKMNAEGEDIGTDNEIKAFLEKGYLYLLHKGDVYKTEDAIEKGIVYDKSTDKFYKTEKSAIKAWESLKEKETV